MRKFKLIKTYPFSPEIGSIATKQGNHGDWYRINESSSHLISEPHLLAFPEHWEEIKEKEWEILSLKYMNNIYSKGNNYQNQECYYIKPSKTDGGIILQENIDNTRALPGVHIYQVKRLSDDISFQINDEVSYQGINSRIKSFRIESYGMMCDLLDGRGINILYLGKEIKKVLFTTEDGVNIYIESEVWWVYKWNWTTKKENLRNFNKKNWDFENYKYFSTEKAAQNYIKCNKPCLSLNDILSLNMEDEETKGTYFSCNKSDLTRLIKSKL